MQWNKIKLNDSTKIDVMKWVVVVTEEVKGTGDSSSTGCNNSSNDDSIHSNSSNSKADRHTDIQTYT